MTLYRIKYSLWRIEAESASEAKKKLCDLLRKNPEDFVFVENASIYDERKPVWKRLLFG
jgi:hypothetical protein